MVIVSLACLWVSFVPVQLGSGRALAWIMQDCGNLHIFQHYSLFLCRLRTPFIEWFPNDVGNECFMRGPGQNILILLSKADTGLAGWRRRAVLELSTIFVDNLWQSGSWAISEWVKVHYYPNLYNCTEHADTKTRRGETCSGFYNHNINIRKAKLQMEMQKKNNYTSNRGD